MRAAMAAGIDQRARPAPSRSRQKMIGRPATLRVLEIAGCADFRGVADVDPALVEDGAIFVLENVGRDEHFAIDRKGLPLPILDHEVAVAVAVLAVGAIVHVQASRGSVGHRSQSSRPYWRSSISSRQMIPAAPAPDDAA